MFPAVWFVYLARWVSALYKSVICFLTDFCRKTLTQWRFTFAREWMLIKIEATKKGWLWPIWYIPLQEDTDVKSAQRAHLLTPFHNTEIFSLLVRIFSRISFLLSNRISLKKNPFLPNFFCKIMQNSWLKNFCTPLSTRHDSYEPWKKKLSSQCVSHQNRFWLRFFFMLRWSQLRYQWGKGANYGDWFSFRGKIAL